MGLFRPEDEQKGQQPPGTTGFLSVPEIILGQEKIAKKRRPAERHVPWHQTKGHGGDPCQGKKSLRYGARGQFRGERRGVSRWGIGVKKPKRKEPLEAGGGRGLTNLLEADPHCRPKGNIPFKVGNQFGTTRSGGLPVWNPMGGSNAACSSAAPRVWKPRGSNAKISGEKKNGKGSLFVGPKRKSRASKGSRKTCHAQRRKQRS